MERESWIEVNLVPRRERDEALLLETLAAVVHGELAGEIETWFFFWEPELRLRIRWRNPAQAQPNRVRLAAQLDESVRLGRASEWYEAAHGRRGERYEGEAELYGAEVWPWVQKDWMSGSEGALLLRGLARAGGASQPLEFHWSRHVHLFTNQLYGTWQEEIELCLRQALGYLRHLNSQGGRAAPEARTLIGELADEAAQGHR
jgi:hypothetical protein